jgi:hypothetical protein
MPKFIRIGWSTQKRITPLICCVNQVATKPNFKNVLRTQFSKLPICISSVKIFLYMYSKFCYNRFRKEVVRGRRKEADTGLSSHKFTFFFFRKEIGLNMESSILLSSLFSFPLLCPSSAFSFPSFFLILLFHPFAFLLLHFSVPTRDTNAWVWQEIKNVLTPTSGRSESERATDLSVSVRWRVPACGLHVEKHWLMRLVVHSGCCANRARHWVDAEVTIRITWVYGVPHRIPRPWNKVHIVMNKQVETRLHYRLM